MKFVRDLLVMILIVLAIVSCGDGTKELHPTRDNETFTMTVNIVHPDAIEQKCNALGVQYEANGCATFNLDTKVCNIYVMPQRFQQDTERLTIIGHETWHCRYGQWHD